jgi:tungstate transport system ATP-binding protein
MGNALFSGCAVATGAPGRARPSLLPLRARGLVFETGGRRLIDGIDLDLAAGGVTVVMGPNGAGKSLLLRVLHGLVAPTAGTITWGQGGSLDAARCRQAMVFQRPVLLRRSVAANIDFVLELRGRRSSERRDELLGAVGLEGRQTMPARLLSGGEQQRLALARALAGEPDVLFLDEPTASLDPASVLKIEEIVAATRRAAVKVIFVTHDIGQARRLADDVVFLHRGRAIEHATASAFFERPATAAACDFLAGRIVL